MTSKQIDIYIASAIQNEVSKLMSSRIEPCLALLQADVAALKLLIKEI